MKKEVIKVKAETVNFIHVEPDSHFYTDLAQLRHSLELGLSTEYLIKGIDNTIANGYQIAKIKKPKQVQKRKK